MRSPAVRVPSPVVWAYDPGGGRTSLAVWRTSLAVWRTSLAVWRTSLVVGVRILAVGVRILAVGRTIMAVGRPIRAVAHRCPGGWRCGARVPRPCSRVRARRHAVPSRASVVSCHLPSSRSRIRCSASPPRWSPLAMRWCGAPPSCAPSGIRWYVCQPRGTTCAPACADTPDAPCAVGHVVCGVADAAVGDRCASCGVPVALVRLARVVVAASFLARTISMTRRCLMPSGSFAVGRTVFRVGSESDHVRCVLS
jgi:hypothetical protein